MKSELEGTKNRSGRMNSLVRVMLGLTLLSWSANAWSQEQHSSSVQSNGIVVDPVDLVEMDGERLEGQPVTQPHELTVVEDFISARFPQADALLYEEAGASRRESDLEAITRLGEGDTSRVSVLVHLDPAIEAAVAGTGVPSQARLGVRQFAQLRNLRIRYEYEVLPNVINIRGLSARDVADLRNLPGVVRIEEDSIKHLTAHDSMPLIRGLESQKAGAGISARGNGVRVCVIDSGIRADHVMFTGRIDAAAGYDFFNDDTNPNDDNGHGTNVAGIAAGGDGFSVNFGTCGSEPFQGVAPGSTIIAVKVCSSGGSCPTSDIVAGINHCASTSLPGGQADVINLSLGGGQFSGTCDTEASAAAANNASSAGVTVVAAAGNNGFTNALGSPACGSQVIAVAAVYDSNFPNCQDTNTSFTWCLNSFCTSTCTDNPVVQDARVCFSNRSSNLDVAAPGSVIWSASSAGASSISGFSGTSQASPHVAGLAALILGLDSSLTPSAVRQHIRDGAIDLGAAGFDNNFGYGRIDVINSLNLVGGGGCSGDPECDDGLFCNGAETCVGGSCQAGTAPNCSDGVACTTDSCNEGTDSCDHTPNNGACDDGLFCNGAETCNATLGCQAGSDPCPGQTCNETTDTCSSGSGSLWMTFGGSTTVPGVGTATNEDIVAYDLGTGTWSLIFDGSDVGLSSFAIDGVQLLSDGRILLSFTAAGTIGGISTDDSDILEFTPTSLGSTTAGTWAMLFDGSDVGLTTNNEDIDAIGLTSDGRLVISTLGSFSVTGASGVDADLIVFNATSLGTTTAGSFAMHFDGSDVDLTTTSEDVDAADLTSAGTILLSTVGSFSVTGASGTSQDIFEFTPTSLGSTTAGTYSLLLDLSTVGIASSANVTSIHLVE